MGWVLNLLVGLITPKRFSTRAYMAQQLAHFGVPKGRLTKECLQELADEAIWRAKAIASIKQQHWLGFLSDKADAIAFNVANQLLLTGPPRSDSFTIHLRKILEKHHSFGEIKAKLS